MSQRKAFDLLRKHSPTISVGILTADLMNLAAELRMLEEVGIKVIHFDVMDAHFAPFLTVGPPFIKGVKTRLLKDAHLMIENPGAQLAEYVQAGADIITVHVDTGDDTPSFLRELGKMENVNDRELGIVRAAAINPDVPVEALKPLLDDIEMISVLAVNARIKGFPFFDSIRERFAEVKEMVAGAGRDILLSIDGGVKRGNIVDIARFGADIVTSGSAIFDGKAAAENARFMLNAVKAQAEQGSV